MPKPTVQLVKRIKELHEKYLSQLPERDLEYLYAHLEGPYHGMESVPNAKYGSPELAKELNRIIAGAPRLPEPMTLYRGATEQSMIPPNEYPLTSTYDPSTAYTYAEGWSDTPSALNPALSADIEVPAGAPGLTFREESFEDIFGRQMPFGDEAEVLLPQRTVTPPLKKLRDLEREVSKVGEREYEILRRFYRYEPPHKARGGLVHGNT